ncbi:mitochondrial inner membrane i-AAA protease supercomplex subunit YME1 [Arthrobacter sp. Hiyo1]|nr:mitochondrial inner membrane i-AAA protease supercomplex subunit YME1 [Arthrobacter sp. Hiyo1]
MEVFPSRLASDPKGLAGALRETFLEIAELEHAVVFIDEVEEIASQRSGEPPSPLQGVTNELLKIIPAFREQPGRLLVCATNFIRALDTAFLRHGRFDYVIPIGLPDVHAREAMWQRFIPASVVDSVDVALLVSRTEGFSPADIEYAARSASQRALEKAVYTADAAGAGASSGGAVPASNARKDQSRRTISTRSPTPAPPSATKSTKTSSRTSTLSPGFRATRVTYGPYWRPGWAVSDPALEKEEP